MKTGTAHSTTKGIKLIHPRDYIFSRKHDERADDVNRACTIWLLKNCPDYIEEMKRWKRTNGLE